MANVKVEKVSGSLVISHLEAVKLKSVSRSGSSLDRLSLSFCFPSRLNRNGPKSREERVFVDCGEAQSGPSLFTSSETGPPEINCCLFRTVLEYFWTSQHFVQSFVSSLLFYNFYNKACIMFKLQRSCVDLKSQAAFKTS